MCKRSLQSLCFSCSTTSRSSSNFWLQKTVLCSPTLIIHLILPSVFLKVKLQLQCCCFQDVHEINNNIYRKFHMLLQKVSFSNTTSSVRNTGPVAYMQKGTTLKGTAMTSNRVTSVWKLLNMPL